MEEGGRTGEEGGLTTGEGGGEVNSCCALRVRSLPHLSIPLYRPATCCRQRPSRAQMEAALCRVPTQGQDLFS